MAAAAAAGGVGGLITPLISYGMNAMAASKSYDRQKNLMTRGPTYQMEGLRKAGINPILAAGGNLGGPGGRAPQASPAARADNLGIAAMQAANLKSSTSANEALARKTDTEQLIRQTELPYHLGRQEFYMSDEGNQLLKDEIYNKSLPTNAAGAAIKGGKRLYNWVIDGLQPGDPNQRERNNAKD